MSDAPTTAPARVPWWVPMALAAAVLIVHAPVLNLPSETIRDAQLMAREARTGAFGPLTRLVLIAEWGLADGTGDSFRLIGIVWLWLAAWGVTMLGRSLAQRWEAGLIAALLLIASPWTTETIALVAGHGVIVSAGAIAWILWLLTTPISEKPARRLARWVALFILGIVCTGASSLGMLLWPTLLLLLLCVVIYLRFNRPPGIRIPLVAADFIAVSLGAALWLALPIGVFIFPFGDWGSGRLFVVLHGGPHIFRSGSGDSGRLLLAALTAPLRPWSTVSRFTVAGPGFASDAAGFAVLIFSGVLAGYFVWHRKFALFGLLLWILGAVRATEPLGWINGEMLFLSQMGLAMMLGSLSAALLPHRDWRRGTVGVALGFLIGMGMLTAWNHVKSLESVETRWQSVLAELPSEFPEPDEDAIWRGDRLLAAQAHRQMAFSQTAAGDLDAVEASWRAVVNADSNDVSALTTLAGILYSQGDLEDALPLAERAAALASDNAVILIDFGNMLHAAERPEEAREVLDRALALTDLNHGDQTRATLAAVNLALVCEALDDIPAADEAWGIALQASPRDARVHREAGAYAIRRERWTAASSLLRRAHDLAPRNADIAHLLAVALLRSGETVDGLAVADQYIQLSGDTAESIANVAILLIQSDMREEAREMAERALEIDPDNAQARDVMARTSSGQINIL